MTVVPAFPVISRNAIGDAALRGRGYEIGAGLSPSRFAQVTDLVFIDKRSREELAEVFGAEPPYPVVMLEQARDRLDFVTAHHVLEHCPDPIGALRQWLRLVRDGGSLFLSIPSSNNSCENLREITPANHFLSDHLFGVTGEDFESRNHIPSFVCQWATTRPELIWYADRGVPFFSNELLTDQGRLAGHDLHWHTFCADTFALCIEAAAYLEGLSVVDLDVQESADELFATGTVRRRRSRKPAVLADFHTDLKRRLRRLR
jgi:SAM-dependent methyltransferase